MTPKIYVDLDDVLAETSRMFLSLLQREFGKMVEYEQLTTFSLERSFGLSSKEWEELFRVAHRPKELLAIAPVPGAQAVLNQWHDQGLHISIVTGRPPESLDISGEWLKSHAIPHDDLLIVDKYGRHNSSLETALSLEKVARMPFSLVVEDSFEVATYLAETMNVAVALKDCPWNRQPLNHPKMNRCGSWYEISRTLNHANNSVADLRPAGA